MRTFIFLTLLTSPFFLTAQTANTPPQWVIDEKLLCFQAENYYQTKQFDKAEAAYKLACNIVPSRFSCSRQVFHNSLPNLYPQKPSKRAREKFISIRTIFLRL